MRNIIKILLFLSIVILIFLSDFFNIQNINIYGNTNILDNEILNNINRDRNIFLIRINPIKDYIYKNPFVYKVDISRNFLTREINIQITERVAIAQIISENNYIAVDRYKIIFPSNSRIENIPIIDMGNIIFTYGEIINIDDDIFKIIKKISNIFNIYKIDNENINLIIQSTENINLTYENINVKFGDYTNLNEKIRIFLSIKPSLSAYKNVGGTLDITDINKNWIFSILT
ncbi:MAG: FtsQ-type POTRA domain-containing protein [Defluviitaleaceae bacterium]|nr:FtsQ-type POTRA domain-containing protein [Defluviitaleaceae bacterium]